MASSFPLPVGPSESPWRTTREGRRTARRTSCEPAQKLSFSSNPHSSTSHPKWVALDSLHSHTFPSGSEQPDPDSTFPTVFAHLGTLRSPTLLDQTDLAAEKLELFEKSVKFHWPNDVASPLLAEETFKRVLYEDPSWFSYSFPGNATSESPAASRDLERRKYNMLRRRQVKAETESWERAADEYRKLQREMVKKNLAPNLPYVKSLFLGWFEPLRDAIAKEQRLQETGGQKTAYAKHIRMLPADKMAVIVMHKMMALLMSEPKDGCARVVQAAINIGDAVEQEVRIHKFLETTRKRRREKGNEDISISEEQSILRSRVTNLMKRKKLREVHKLVKSENDTISWGRAAQAKLGCRLIELLIDSAFVQYPSDRPTETPPDVHPAFRHVFRSVTKENGRCGRRYGVIEFDSMVHEGLKSIAKHSLVSYMPMLVPPKKWKGFENGGHLYLPSYVMRTHGERHQKDAMKSVPEMQLRKVFKALDILGSTKWRINKKVLGVVEVMWSEGGCLAGLVERADISIPEKPDTQDMTEVQKWRWDYVKAKKINSERHALRCDTELKLMVARKMRDEEGFYYPHNLDFRGRAYPMHSHLNHLSSDLCRGVLEFAEGRPLGKSGMRWLKIQLANLYAGGIEKLSLDDRLGFVEDNLHYILDSANRPIDGERWWLGAEDPFQFLATCINFSEALGSSSPDTVISRLPIHQDGSCNGLQHYAALGRESEEAAAVNLVAGAEPSDVYSGIAARVLDYIRRDSQKDPSTCPNALLAKILVDQVDRKLVKQTVMTSVYGVTYIGAREQIKRRLDERGLTVDERILFKASCYAANVTMMALGEMFQAARGIMKWLGDCAKVIASADQPVRWTTPLGLPVIQPYMKARRHMIRTSLQILTLQRESNSVEAKRQRTAFPPNFIHSLDGSHMMMTAIACKDKNLRFAGVHDSFWTHACDVDQMNLILREQFVNLYSTPILENLLEGFQTSYPTLDFPSLPDRGDFDLNEVLRSPYFFN